MKYTGQKCCKQIESIDMGAEEQGKGEMTWKKDMNRI